MKLSTLRRYRRNRSKLSTKFSQNSFLLIGLDLPFIIACGNSVRIAMAMSLHMMIVHILTVCTALITVHFMPKWIHFPVNVFFAFIAMSVSRFWIVMLFPDVYNHVGMYLYLMAVNGTTMQFISALRPSDIAHKIFGHALLNVVIFTIVIGFVSILREYLASSTFWGIKVPISLPINFPVATMPFFGFIITGVLLALTKFVNRQMAVRQITKELQRGF